MVQIKIKRNNQKNSFRISTKQKHFVILRNINCNDMPKEKYTEKQIKLARYAKALSHPVRIQLLEILSKQSCCYSGDIAQDLPIARSTLSQHLSELKEAGLIQGEFTPPKIKYCLRRENWEDAKRMMEEFFEGNKE
jgi:DNA-binding HxlR family transcriptional regulator